jgi:hypothetical protein
MEWWTPGLPITRRMTGCFIAVHLGGFQHPRYIGFHIPCPRATRGEPSRSDELMVAVGLQPTESGFGKLGASRQRRLSANRRRGLRAVWVIQSSLRDVRTFGRPPRGLKPPGYHHAPLRGDGRVTLYKNPVLRPRVVGSWAPHHSNSPALHHSLPPSSWRLDGWLFWGVDRVLPTAVRSWHERVWAPNSPASIYGRPVV